MIVALVVVATALTSVATSQVAAFADAAADFVSLINAERSQAGLAPLRREGDLDAVALRQAQRMADSRTLGHNPNLGSEVDNWVWLAENVGTGSSVDSTHRELMASSSHRDDIMSVRATEAGVGVVWADGDLWVSQVFREPETPAPSTPSEAPPPDPPAPTVPAPTSPEAAPVAQPTPPAVAAPPTSVPPAAKPTPDRTEPPALDNVAAAGSQIELEPSLVTGVKLVARLLMALLALMS